MVGSLILFVLFVIVYILISDVITIIFRLTGMSEETARFQAISLLTNSGFTTNESETVLASSLRRKIARFTMLFGYTFTVTIVSTTVNFFMSLRESELSSLLVYLPLFAVTFLVFYLIRKSVRFRTWFDGLIERWGTQMLFGKNVNRVLLVERYGDMAVAHIYLHTVPEILRDTTLAASGIRSKHNIMVLMVKGLRIEARQADADTVLRPHDIVMVMGNLKDIYEVFEQPPEKTEKPSIYGKHFD